MAWLKDKQATTSAEDKDATKTKWDGWEARWLKLTAIF